MTRIDQQQEIHPRLLEELRKRVRELADEFAESQGQPYLDDDDIDDIIGKSIRGSRRGRRRMMVFWLRSGQTIVLRNVNRVGDLNTDGSKATGYEVKPPHISIGTDDGLVTIIHWPDVVAWQMGEELPQQTVSRQIGFVSGSEV